MPCSAPILNGASKTIRTNGADSRKKSHKEEIATTRMPRIFMIAQTVTMARPTINPRLPTENHGKSRVRYATNSVG